MAMAIGGMGMMGKGGGRKATYVSWWGWIAQKLSHAIRSNYPPIAGITGSLSHTIPRLGFAMGVESFGDPVFVFMMISQFALGLGV